MFDRRRLPMFFSVLLSILLAAGFVPYSMGLLPMLESLYFDGWWTLLLIFPSLAQFIQEGYSRPALGVLASGLLLFANATGKIPVGMLPESALYTALASVASGSVIELTDRRQKKKYAALKAAAEREQLKEASIPFAPEAEKKTAAPNYSYIPRRAEDSSASPAAGQMPPQPQKASSSKGWMPPTQTVDTPKTGWDPNKTYTRPKNAQLRPSAQPKKSDNLLESICLAVFGDSKLSLRSTFPVSISIFGNSHAVCDDPNITGGLVLSIFGDASLSLREADYQRPSSVLVLSIFGNCKLEVPYISNVSYTGIPIFGSCKDKRQLVNSDQMPILSVQSFAIFGDNTVQ